MEYTAQQKQVMLFHPAIKRQIKIHYKYNFAYDIPGLVGLSTDRRTIYIDRRCFPRSKKIVNALKSYILTRKGLFDIYHISPNDARDLALSVISSDVAASLKGYKAINLKKKVNIPLNLDTSFFHPYNAKIIKKKIKQARKRKDLLDTTRKIRYDKQLAEYKEFVSRNLHKSKDIITDDLFSIHQNS